MRSGRWLGLLGWLCIVVGIPGCFYSPPSRRRPIESALPYQGPLPRFSGDGSARAEIPAPYRIGRKDVLDVSVRDLPEFDGKLEVDREGRIRIPTIERELDVEGMTVQQVERRVTDTLAVYSRIPPEVRVKVEQPQSKFYYAFGAVGSPGRHPMGEDAVNLRDALLGVGLFRPGAASWKTYIITPHPTDPTHVVVDARDLLLGRTAENIQVKPDDIIYVPTSAYTKVNRVLDEFIFQVNQGINVDSLVQFLEDRLKPGGADTVTR